MQIMFKTSILGFISCFLWANNPLIAQTALKDTFEYQYKKPIRQEWQTYGIPGIVLQTYYPDLKDSLGSFRGISVEYLIAAWIHQNENKGPSHGRLYAKINFMKSSKPQINDIFYMALGLNLSLERNPEIEIQLAASFKLASCLSFGKKRNPKTICFHLKKNTITIR